MTPDRKWLDQPGFTVVNVYEAIVGSGPLPVEVPNSPATAQALLCSWPFREALYDLGVDPEDAHLGVDILRLEAGTAFDRHVHPGHHMLLNLRGRGQVTLWTAGDPQVFSTAPGDLCLINGAVEHAVAAIDDHFLLAFGAPHVHVEDPTRMLLTGDVPTLAGGVAPG